MESQHTYFVHYTYQKGGMNGEGMTSIETAKKLENIQDVIEIADHICNTRGFDNKSVVITNIQRFPI